ISRLIVNKGNLVGSGSPTLLATVVNTDPMQVWVSVREADILEFRRQLVGENKANIRDMNVEFTLILPDGDAYPETGLIDFVDSTIDANTGTIDVRGTIPNPIGILKPGLFVRMEIESRQTFEGLMIPELAVMRDMAGEYVMVIDESDVVSRQGIVTARTKDHLTEVTTGLNAESKVIVNGLLQARPNQKVSPTLMSINDAMKKLDPQAVAARALEISRKAFARMIEERTGRPAPETGQAQDKTTATTTETGT
ncbi:MAG: efflux RND transporter periplasmic adaptor subunit, partial [Phycisphaerales bacterium]|nr:efflux RND transporter periplasmic adaptor subunit [Phycisphaerales bacterium]